MINPAHVTVYMPGERPVQYDLKGQDGFIVIGRLDKCEITVPIRRLSREHAQIEIKDGRYRLLDLGSANGTFLNGQPLLGSAPLSDGDRISMGGVLLRFELGRSRTDDAPGASDFKSKMYIDALDFSESDLEGLLFHDDHIDPK